MRGLYSGVAKEPWLHQEGHPASKSVPNMSVYLLWQALAKKGAAFEAQKLRHSQKKLPKFKQSIKIGKKHYLSGMAFGATKKISNKQQIYG